MGPGVQVTGGCKVICPWHRMAGHWLACGQLHSIRANTAAFLTLLDTKWSGCTCNIRERVREALLHG